MLAEIASLRLEVTEDLASASSSVFLIGAGVILINGAWLSLMAFALSRLSDHLSLLASLSLVGTFTGMIGTGLAAAGVQRLRQREVARNPAKIQSAELVA